MENTWLCKTFKLKYPIILAPMFLVSNNKMLIEAAKAGITGCIPSLNFRTPEDLEIGLKDLKENCPGAWGVNLIVNKSNLHLEKHLALLEKYPPSYIITSLGSPEECIRRLKPLGVKIFCDVVDVEYAKKVEALGADAVIAVNSGAGGHAGKIPASILVPMLKEACKIPVLSAGGVGTGRGLFSILALGADGVSIGSPYIATLECGVTSEYKEAIVNYGAKDIVMTSKLSGTPCTVINTPYVQKIGTDQNILEEVLNKNKKLKKYMKALTFYRGMKSLEKAAFGATYQTVWCAGPSIEFTHKIETVREITERLGKEFDEAVADFNQKFKK